MASKHVSLHSLFSNLQKQMYADLTSARECFDHPGAKGDASEICWLKMLGDYLPKRYCADKAFVIDHEGNKSEQIDIVIYDRQYSPFIFKHNNNMHIPAESVYAVIEAKQEINKGMIEYAAEKAASVRRLKRTNAHFAWIQGNSKRPELFTIPSGIVSLSSSWSPALGAPFEKIIQSLSENPQTRIDFGCAVEGGAFDTFYSPEGGAPQILTTAGSLTLMTFFLKFLSRLQKLGTVPAMDIPSYLATVAREEALAASSGGA